MGYSRRTSSYPTIIILSNSIHMMSMADLMAIGVKTTKIESGCSLEKDFTKSIHMNP